MLRVLIIDDDLFFREAYKLSFPDADFNVSIAVNGEEGIRKMKELKPDVVLLDFIMPKIDGAEVLDVAKNDADLQHIPIIVISSIHVDKEDIIKRGAEAVYLKSDIGTLQLADVVTTVIASKKKSTMSS